MSDDPRTESLHEWNRLARQNAENAIISSMFEAGFKAIEPADSFSTWLLAGAAAVASFFISNADKLIPFISQPGFLACGALLCSSCLLGLISKLFALKCKIQIDASNAARTTFLEHLNKHRIEEEKISEAAKVWGISIETGIRMDRVLSEFFKPLPRWVGWLVNRRIKRQPGNPQLGHLPIINGMQWQGIFVVLQTLSFFAFLITGFCFAAAI
jgi:hypothetical protein